MEMLISDSLPEGRVGGPIVLREGWPGSQQWQQISGHSEDHSQGDGACLL
jgi:hypothetical protein